MAGRSRHGLRFLQQAFQDVDAVVGGRDLSDRAANQAGAGGQRRQHDVLFPDVLVDVFAQAADVFAAGQRLLQRHAAFAAGRARAFAEDDAGMLAQVHHFALRDEPRRIAARRS
ncbi:hypothetical protein G6F57_019895 [Rhizopus arrhizus]|nr:hypothetical protein G6F57_019895 [Rhizopus arrhizus]